MSNADYNLLWQSSMPRDEFGKFEPSPLGEKRMRSMKLTDEAWDSLELKAEKLAINRTELIERFARDEHTRQDIIMEALEAFMKRKQEQFGSASSQKGKEFNSTTRSWDVFNEFKELMANSPWELLGEE
jgi:hypothetical protein